MMLRDDYYSLLGVPRSATASQIKRSYRKLVSRWHPDVNPTLADAEERLKRLNAAYEVLRDRGSRDHYDRMLDLFAMSGRIQQRPTTPRTVAERRRGAVRPLVVTVMLAACVLWAGLSFQEERPVPMEWSARALQADRPGPARLSPDQIESNCRWMEWFWKRELEIRPASRFAADNLAATYSAMAVCALRRGDRRLALHYRQSARSVSPISSRAPSEHAGGVRS